jgi:hypothetical protein
MPKKKTHPTHRHHIYNRALNHGSVRLMQHLLPRSRGEQQFEGCHDIHSRSPVSKVWCIRTLSDQVLASSQAFIPVSILADAHREVSVALVQSQGYVYRSWALLLAKAAGQQ